MSDLSLTRLNEMPFDGTRFFEAVKGWPHDISFKYLIYLWQYWKATHCTGLINDDEILRRMGECELSNWARVRGLIFDGNHFFFLENGKWHQKRCREFYHRELARYQKNLEKTEPARNQALVTRIVSESVTDADWLKSLADNPIYAGVDIKRELGKLAAWCSVNRKDATRRRFINWLNRVEKPLNGSLRQTVLKSTPPPRLRGQEQDEATLKRMAEQVEAHRRNL